MVRTPNKCCDVYGIRLISLCTIGCEISDFIRFLRVCGVILPLQLPVFVEDVDEFLANLVSVSYTHLTLPTKA